MTHTLHIRKFAFAMLLMLSFAGFSQNVPINFETGGNGATWTWTTFENGTTSAPMHIISNPVSGGINTSATVAKLIPLVVGQPWAGVESSHGAGIGTWTVSASNSTIKIMVYKSVISDVGIKLVTSTGGSTGEIKKPNTVLKTAYEKTHPAPFIYDIRHLRSFTNRIQ